MKAHRRSVGWRAAASAIVVLPMGCTVSDGFRTGLAGRLIGPPQADPVVATMPPGGRVDRIALGRPDRTIGGLREMPGLLAETALLRWDGRPTLPGLWVAHPQALRAGRVRLRNLRTGTVVDAALLPRRSAAAHPVLSAEAADALGLLPDVPSPVRMVALGPEAGTDRPGADRDDGAPARPG